MNKDRAVRHSRISRQIMLQYVLALVGFVAALVLFVFVAWQVCSMFVWYDNNPLYYILKFVQGNILLFISLPLLTGWTLITYRYISKPLRYLDEVIAAAEHMTINAEQPVELPPVLADTQNEMNLVRESALRNAVLAKEAEQRKNDLIVYLAHDLKTPLTSVIGYLTLLRDEPQISQELRAKYTGIALGKAQRLEELINEFFDITRFNLSHLELVKESCNLSRMLEQLTFEFRPVLAERGLSWDLSLAPDVRILCDPDKLERVFDNLFRNAVHYGDPDTAVFVGLTRQEDAAVVQVRNRGKTIPPEKLSRIFEQFFRLDSSRTSATGGAGLGLAIAKEIVELHSGAIAAESADGSVCFTVTLPLLRQEIV